MDSPGTSSDYGGKIRRARRALAAATRRMNPLVLAGGAYVAGFLVINLHMARLGVAHIDLIRSDYVLAGCTWALLSWTAFLIPLGIWRIFLTVAGRIPGDSFGLGAGLARMVILVVAVWAAHAIFSFLSGGQISILSIEGAKIGGVLFLNGFMAVNFGGITLAEIPDKAITDKTWFGQIYKWLLKSFFSAVVFLVAVFLYSHGVFPRLSPFLGGGRGQEVIVIFNQRGIGVAKAAGLEAQEGARGFAVDLLFEDSRGLVFRWNDEGQQGPTAAVFRVPRELVDGVIYSGNWSATIGDRDDPRH